jgi:hypothetical protein
MEPKTLTYLVYLLIAVPLTVWVARTLSRNGRVFLVDVFSGNGQIADAVNQLLVVGFYLINVGYICLWLRIADAITDTTVAIETLAAKLGLVMLVLGGMHLFNVFVFHKLREKRLAENERKELYAGVH